MKRSRKELIEIFKKIMKGHLSGDEEDKLIDELNKHVPHPHGINLLYYPKNYDQYKARDKISEYDLSPEEVVEKALSYKPIQL